jgi:hypothetical protein
MMLGRMKSLVVEVWKVIDEHLQSPFKVDPKWRSGGDRVATEDRIVGIIAMNPCF